MSDHRVQPGKYVSLTYSICDEQGSVLEHFELPVGFVYGSDTELVGGMDQAIRDRRAGESVEVAVSVEDGFGPRDPDLLFTDDLQNVPQEFRHLGAAVPMHNDAGEEKTFYVTRIEDGRLTLDGNHPLAGRPLIVRVNILEVRDALPGEERVSGIHAAAVPGSQTIN